MRAVLCAEYGEPSTVAVRDDVPAPVLGPGQVRVGVAAAAANFSDVLLIADKYQVKVPTPFIPGSEFAGTVLDVAEGVDGIRVGDRVLGAVFVGAFAEQVVVDAGAVQVLPPNADVALAAAFGVAHRTAFHALRLFARVSVGDRIVVLGAGGGVGLAAVQLGRVLGAEVTAVASSDDKLEAASRLGATNLINHRTCELRAALKAVVPDGAAAVIDPVGGPLSEPALRSLRWRGRFVTVGFAAGDIPRIPLNLVLLKGAEVVGFQLIDLMTHGGDEYANAEKELMDLFVAGRAAPHIGASFGLADAAAALRLVAEGRAVGKVILTIGESL